MKAANGSNLLIKSVGSFGFPRASRFCGISSVPYKCIAFSPSLPYLQSMAKRVGFEWDEEKNWYNQIHHGVSFAEAQYAFADRNRVILKDHAHSRDEERFYCIGKVGEGIMTVRFTYRSNRIRIFGAGYWRKGRKIYEEQNLKKD